MDDVYVVEIAITGPKGVPADTVAKVAVSRMLMDGSDFDTVYSGSIAIDPKNIGREGLDHLSGNYGIRPEELYSSEGIDEMVRRLQDAVFGKECTSYNVGNVFEEYLSFKSWDCTGNLTILPSISMRLPPELREPQKREHDLLRAASDSLCPGSPACVGAGRRMLDLAQMVASVLMRLRHGGWYQGRRVRQL